MDGLQEKLKTNKKPILIGIALLLGLLVLNGQLLTSYYDVGDSGSGYAITMEWQTVYSTTTWYAFYDGYLGLGPEDYQTLYFRPIATLNGLQLTETHLIHLRIIYSTNTEFVHSSDLVDVYGTPVYPIIINTIVANAVPYTFRGSTLGTYMFDYYVEVWDSATAGYITEASGRRYLRVLSAVEYDERFGSDDATPDLPNAPHDLDNFYPQFEYDEPTKDELIGFSLLIPLIALLIGTIWYQKGRKS